MCVAVYVINIINIVYVINIIKISQLFICIHVVAIVQISFDWSAFCMTRCSEKGPNVMLQNFP